MKYGRNYIINFYYMPFTRSHKRRYKKRKQTRKRIKMSGGKGGGEGGRRNKRTTKSRMNYNGGAKDDFKKLTCSPLSDEYKNGSPVSAHKTCLPSHIIYKAKDYWNTANPQNEIHSKTPRQIWLQLQKKLKNVCKDDLCILEQPFMKKMNSTRDTTESINSSSGGTERNLKDYYSPKMPSEWKKNPTEWLSSIEILEKMKQYEKAYPCFEFIGPTAIDFDKVLSDNKCVERDMCNFQLSTQIEKKKKKIGIIFNTDPHDKGGSHWISLFINIPKKMIFFFDSAGETAPPEVMTFVERIKEQGLKLNPPIDFKFDQNYPHEHQYSTTECGMYSLYFIINMLEDKLTTEYLKTHIITDSQMIKYRKKYFNDV